MHSITLSSYTTTPSLSSLAPLKSRSFTATSTIKHHAPFVCKASGSSSYSITDFDLYDLLGVDSSSDHSAIKQAYRSLQKKCHPDIAGIAGHDMAIILNEAYAVLSDPLLRFDYDKVLFSLICWFCVHWKCSYLDLWIVNYLQLITYSRNPW